jgi:hypothetical protein
MGVAMDIWLAGIWNTAFLGYDGQPYTPIICYVTTHYFFKCVVTVLMRRLLYFKVRGEKQY